MSRIDIDPHIDYTDKFQSHDDKGIGIVGAGTIVDVAHLPAYQKAGFNIRGVTDIDTERAERLAEEYSITAYRNLNELLNDDSIDVVDIAVPPSYQRDMVERVVNTGRHVLCQKPLSNDFEEALEIKELIDNAGVMSAVNQQLRWEKGMATVKDLLERGEFGEPLRMKFDVNLMTNFMQFDWLADAPRLDMMIFSLHQFDILRYLLGEPNRVYSSVAQSPRQEEVGEKRSIAIFEYDGDLRAHTDINHAGWDDSYAKYRIQGTEASAKGTVALLQGTGMGGDRFEFKSRDNDSWDTYSIQDARFPDAFIGPMGSLLDSIDSGEPPMTHPKDNIRSLKLMNAAYLAANEKRAINPRNVSRDYYAPWTEPSA